MSTLAATTSDGDDQQGQRTKQAKGYFFPPLAQQRWVYCLDLLKQQDIKSVCEAGCGPGSVLYPMTNSASHIDSFPELYLDLVNADEIYAPTPEDASEAAEGDQHTPTRDFPYQTSLNEDVLSVYRSLPRLRGSDKELHLRRIAGLDIDLAALDHAVQVTAPLPSTTTTTNYKQQSPTSPSELVVEEESDYNAPRDRWEDLRVELWQGSIDVYNDALDNFEAFILTEVIEHLQPKTLNRFPDILFGNYRPRLVVVTTPNYEFNQFFSRKSSSEKVDDAQQDYFGDEGETLDESNYSILDPTGRTDRRFRDSDHKFEWTRKEFQDWCKGITKDYDYSVEFGGVGSLSNFFGKGGMREIDPTQPRQAATSPFASLPPDVVELCRRNKITDPTRFFATQTAVFKRKFAYESERNPRSPVQVPLAFFNAGASQRSGRQGGPAPQASGIVRDRSSSSNTSNNSVKMSTSSSRSSPLTSTTSPISPPASLDGVNLTLSPTSLANAQHKMIKTHFYKASKYSGHAQPLSKIRAVLEETMRERMGVGKCSVRELWGRSLVARSCGGYVTKIIEAVLHEPLPHPSSDGSPPSRKWAIEYDSEVLKKGNQIEDAVFLVLKDFVEPVWESVSDEKEDDGASDEDEDEPSLMSQGLKRLRIIGQGNHQANVADEEATPTDPHKAKDSSSTPSNVNAPEWQAWGEPSGSSTSRSNQDPNPDGWI